MNNRVCVVQATLLRGAMTLAAVAALGAFSGCAHNPNHGVNMDDARAAARRVHTPPDPSVKMTPGHGG